ncbi:hypothetical protein B0H14DRAFT_2561117 [Mycena olivaceomarginata]|nr:hypothetical protein B0H14DRAFT_2561117 [Mycena olivaceomarginata]
MSERPRIIDMKTIIEKQLHHKSRGAALIASHRGIRQRPRPRPRMSRVASCQVGTRVGVASPRLKRLDRFERQVDEAEKKRRQAAISSNSEHRTEQNRIGRRRLAGGIAGRRRTRRRASGVAWDMGEKRRTRTRTRAKRDRRDVPIIEVDEGLVICVERSEDRGKPARNGRKRAGDCRKRVKPAKEYVIEIEKGRYRTVPCTETMQEVEMGEGRMNDEEGSEAPLVYYPVNQIESCGPVRRQQGELRRRRKGGSVGLWPCVAIDGKIILRFLNSAAPCSDPNSWGWSDWKWNGCWCGEGEAWAGKGMGDGMRLEEVKPRCVARRDWTERGSARAFVQRSLRHVWAVGHGQQRIRAVGDSINRRRSDGAADATARGEAALRVNSVN